ncbi:MAG TPA: type-F conjugative transfer system secretin TraK [Candidatus Babeliales bacterium]|nr:type-F conjugative transfer system secretin TraK [Candidatus Babeliales bacterium]
MRNFTLVFILIYILGATTSFALQIKAIKDNQTVSAKISAKELTRIFVSGDRIQSTRGVNGAYELIKDEKLGAVFIKSSPFYLHKPFNLFVTTELGHTYNLLLTPMDIPAENIELKPLSPSMIVASRWERNLPYLETLIRLMNNMVNEIKPEGYAVIDLPNIKPKGLPSGLTMQLVTIYRGGHLQGEIWRLKNTCRNTLYLKPREFFQDNVRAISLESETLRCLEETYLYRVVDHD